MKCLVYPVLCDQLNQQAETRIIWKWGECTLSISKLDRDIESLWIFLVTCSVGIQESRMNSDEQWFIFYQNTLLGLKVSKVHATVNPLSWHGCEQDVQDDSWNFMTSHKMKPNTKHNTREAKMAGPSHRFQHRNYHHARTDESQF